MGGGLMDIFPNRVCIGTIFYWLNVKGIEKWDYYDEHGKWVPMGYEKVNHKEPLHDCSKISPKFPKFFLGWAVRELRVDSWEPYSNILPS